MREREGLIARIRQVRRAAAASVERARPSTTDSDAERVHALERRVADLEELVQGLQDSVYRESLRQSELISKLQSQVQPAAIAAALSKDARERGL
jgi:predicted methyltransferase MtxX (methanogen marker protein 4)